MAGNHHDAADLTQHTFLKALAAWEDFDGKCMVTTWLYRILINGCRDWRRRKDSRVQALPDEWAVRVADDAPTPAEAADQSDELARLRQGILALPDTLRPAFVATVLDGMTYEEAAELLNTHVGTIASRVHAARCHLTQAMLSARAETGEIHER
jgi:RNA polymerase sigma-70 factor (ECF subfamily)